MYDLVPIPGWEWKIETFNPRGYRTESPEDFYKRITKWFEGRSWNTLLFIPRLQNIDSHNPTDLQDFLIDTRGNTKPTNYLIVTHGKHAFI